MVFYARAGRRPDPDAERKGSRFLLGLGNFFLHWFLWALHPLEALSLRMGLTPDLFNLAAVAFGLASGGLLATGRFELGGWGIVLGGVCDILDGRIARATGTTSLYGRFIDSTLDRFVEFFVFLGFAYRLRVVHAVGPFLATAALGGSFLVSYAQARGEALGIVCSVGLMQRAERLVLTSLSCLLDPFLSRLAGQPEGTLVTLAMAALAVGSVGTAIHRTVWISTRLRKPR